MNTTFTDLKGLNKQLIVEVPIVDFNVKFDKALNDLKIKARIDGFRQGRVPASVIKQKYGASINNDVANDIVSEVLPKVFTEHKINPAGQPNLTKLNFENKEYFIFTVEFEVFPKVKLGDLAQLKIEKITCSISKTDEDKTLNGLKEQVAEFKLVERVSNNNDRLKINFKGLINGKSFEGSDAKDFALILGKKTMITGFEDGLIGKKSGEEVKLEIKFPKQYHIKDLADKPVIFTVKIITVEEGSKVKVNDEFAKKFGKDSVDELLSGIKEQMQNQLNDKLEQLNKDAVFSAILDNNNLEVPIVSVTQEAKHLLEDMNNRMKQQSVPDNNTKLSASIFNDEATRRVKLGILVGDITAKNKIKATDEQVQNKLQFMASEYGKQGEQMIKYYNSNPSAMDSIHSMVVEKLASDFIMSQAKITEVEKKFSEVVG